MIVSIVSGGPSASFVNLAKIPGTIIGVNSATLFAPKVDHAVTMDRRWAEQHWPWMKERGEAGRLKVWLRRNNVCNIHERPDWLTIYKNDHRSPVMSDEPETLNGTNSGGIALNLAYSMRPKTVYLFGFDYRTGPKGQWHWFAKNGPTTQHGSSTVHDGRYGGWARQFEVTAPQFKAAGIDVVNVSDTSVVTAFRKLSPSKFTEYA